MSKGSYFQDYYLQNKSKYKQRYLKNKKQILKYRHKHYLLNKEKYKMQSKYRKQSYREEANIILRDLKINGCTLCGYNKCCAALEFHHVNPKDKRLHINQYGIMNYKNEQIIAELNKCILFCANCHREIEQKK